MKIIPLTKGYEAIVDDEDFERFGHLNWYANVTSKKYGLVYAARGVRDRRAGTHTRIYLHREIAQAEPHEDVDHDNGDTLDCRRSNLKSGTTAQNCWNIHTPPRGRVALRGVHINRHGIAQAAISANGRHVHLGTFDSPELAAAAYERAAALRAAGRGAEIGRDPGARGPRGPWSTSAPTMG